MSTLGNASDFGDLLSETAEGSGCSNTTRGLFMSGSGPLNDEIIEFITIATLGNSQDFGDLSQSTEAAGCCASSTRGLAAGGTTPTKVNTIEFVTIATLGNAQDFGDRTVTGYGVGGLSDVHGGIGD